MSQTIYTIGHSNHDEDTFVGLLQQHDVEVLVDVRSQPYCKFASHFSATPIRHLAHRAGAQYLFLGRELGGRPEGDPFFDEEGYVLYWKVAQAPFFHAGLDRLQTGCSRYRVALMCSEENPAVCHRHLLVARVLQDAGREVLHIRGDGSTQSYHETEKQRLGSQSQRLLFGDLEEETWKSLRSVSPKLEPPSSLESWPAQGSGD